MKKQSFESHFLFLSSMRDYYNYEKSDNPEFFADENILMFHKSFSREHNFSYCLPPMLRS